MDAMDYYVLSSMAVIGACAAWTYYGCSLDCNRVAGRGCIAVAIAALSGFVSCATIDDPNGTAAFSTRRLYVELTPPAYVKRMDLDPARGIRVLNSKGDRILRCIVEPNPPKDSK